MTFPAPYCGRFAPSPTGPLHLGSLSAALASWLDARCHQGKWLIRIEDVDGERQRPGAAQHQLDQLARLGLVPDSPPEWQSRRVEHYAAALDRLRSQGLVYVCHCTRRRLSQAASDGVYPGTCRNLSLAEPGAWRFRVASGVVGFVDRRCGLQQQDVSTMVGDFCLRRRDGWWAYQLAVVVDDAHQGVTHVVRGEDLLDNTARQIQLQRALGLPTPAYLHLPLVRDARGHKLSKADQAPALGALGATIELDLAWQSLGFAAIGADCAAAFLTAALPLWQARYGEARP